MAIVDWPTDRAFFPSAFQVGTDVPQSSWRGLYTGTRETYVHAADRLVATLMLPPCKAADAAERESFIGALLSTGDLVRMPMWQRRYLRGNLAGSITVGSTLAAGVRSVALANALSGSNLITGSGFEIDTNADGMADGWVQYTSGSVGTVTVTMPAASGNTGTAGLCQRVSSTALNGAIGVRRSTDVAVTTGLNYTWSITQSATAGTTVSLEIAWYTSGAVYISSSTATAAASNGRRSVTGAAPATAALARLYVYCNSSSSTAVALNVDEAQFEQSAAVTTYAGLPVLQAGDWFGVGGNLLQCKTTTTGTDAGALAAVPLVYPVQKAITSGAAVTVAAPTGVWQLDTTGMRFEYSAGMLQEGVALQFRQVIV